MNNINANLDNRAYLEVIDRYPQPHNKSTIDLLLGLSNWLLLLPLVIALIFSSAHLGLLIRYNFAYASTQANASAEYGPWSYMLINSIRSEIIKEIRFDRVNDHVNADALVGLLPGRRRVMQRHELPLLVEDRAAAGPGVGRGFVVHIPFTYIDGLVDLQGYAQIEPLGVTEDVQPCIAFKRYRRLASRQRWRAATLRHVLQAQQGGVQLGRRRSPKGFLFKL